MPKPSSIISNTPENYLIFSGPRLPSAQRPAIWSCRFLLSLTILPSPPSPESFHVSTFLLLITPPGPDPIYPTLHCWWASTRMPHFNVTRLGISGRSISYFGDPWDCERSYSLTATRGKRGGELLIAQLHRQHESHGSFAGEPKNKRLKNLKKLVAHWQLHMPLLSASFPLFLSPSA